MGAHNRTVPQSSLIRTLLISSVALITLAAFENLAVTAVMPVIARELDGLTLYALAMGLPLATHVAATAVAALWVDARSVRWPIVSGVALFSVGLIMAGVVDTIELVAIGRGISGLGTGLIVVSLYAAVGSIVPAERRPGFFAAFAAAWVVPGLVGPMIAGYIAQWFSWRWVFLAVGIPCLIAIPIVNRFLARATAGAQTGRVVNRDEIVTRARRTLLPAAGVAVAIAVMQTASSSEKSLPIAVVSLIVAFVLLPLLLPKGTLTLRPGVPSVVVSRMLGNAVIIAVEAYFLLYLQNERGWDPGPAGLVVTIGSVTWALGSYAQTRVHDPAKRLRLARVGAVLLTLGAIGATTVTLPAVHPAFSIAGWALAGFGMGMMYSIMAVLALEYTPQERHGEISGSLQIADSGGAAITLSLFGALYVAFGSASIDRYVPGFLLMVAFAALSIVAVRRVPNLTRPSLPDDASSR